MPRSPEDELCCFVSNVANEGSMSMCTSYICDMNVAIKASLERIDLGESTQIVLTSLLSEIESLKQKHASSPTLSPVVW